MAVDAYFKQYSSTHCSPQSARASPLVPWEVCHRPSWNGGHSLTRGSHCYSLTASIRLNTVPGRGIADSILLHAHSFTTLDDRQSRRAQTSSDPPVPPVRRVRPISTSPLFTRTSHSSQQKFSSAADRCKEHPTQQYRAVVHDGRTPPLDAAARRRHGQDARHPPRPRRVRRRNPARGRCSTAAAASASPVPIRCARWVHARTC